MAQTLNLLAVVDRDKLNEISGIIKQTKEGVTYLILNEKQDEQETTVEITS